MSWIVGRGDPAIYVMEDEPSIVGCGIQLGEAQFDNEVEALRYAIACEEDTIAPIKENLRDLKARLRKLERRGKK